MGVLTTDNPGGAMVRIRLRAHALGQAVFTIAWVRVQWDGTGADPVTCTLEDLVTEVIEQWDIDIRGNLNEEYVLDDVGFSEIILIQKPDGKHTIPWPQAIQETLYIPPSLFQGAIANPALPSFVTCSIQFRTGYPGRNGRGGLHLGPLAESQTETGGNTLTSTAKDAFSAACVGFATPSTVGPTGYNFYWTVFSMTQASAAVLGADVALPPGPYANNVTVAYPNSRVGSQVSRKDAGRYR